MTAKRIFAEGTTVPPERTRLEIEQLVTAASATAFGFMVDGDRGQVRFVLSGRHLRFDLPLPRIDEERFRTVHRGAAGIQARTLQGQRAAWEKACREKWRALLLTIKAKLTAIESGVVSFDEEFMAHVVMPDGKTVAEVIRDQIALAYSSGEQPRLLADYTGGRG